MNLWLRGMIFIMRGKILLALLISLLLITLLVFLKFPQSGGKIQNILLPQTPAISPLSLEKIFAEDHNFTATFSARDKRTLITTGDIILARSVNAKEVKLKNFLWPFAKAAPFLKSADLTFINFESPLIPNCPIAEEGIKFCGDPQNLEGLISAGVDVVNLANNHLGDWGLSGIESTIKLLNGAGISTTGGGSLAFKNVKGLNFAFLGFNDLGGQKLDLCPQIKQAKNEAKIVVVAFHWGKEYTSQPTPRQKELGHSAIDCGADLVIGNHPHWIQPVEIYQNKAVIYAHGNFIFDQMWSQKTKEGIVAKFTFFEDKLLDVQFFPIQIENFGQPYFLEGEKKKEVLEEMEKLSVGESS